MAERIVLVVSLCCWLLAEVASCQSEIGEKENDFQRLCQEERELKSRYDSAPEKDQSFADYLKVYQRRKALGKEVRQQFCPLNLESAPSPPKPSQFSTPLTWSLEMTEKFGDLDLLHEICWHELLTRRELASAPYNMFRTFQQEYELAKEKKNVLGKKLGEDCESPLSHWPGRSEFPQNHRTNEDFMKYKCFEEAKSQLICDRLRSATFSDEIMRQANELSQLWCQRYQFIKWIRSSVCNDEQAESECCLPNVAQKGLYEAVEVLAETIATETEKAIENGVHYEKRDWYEFIIALESHVSGLKVGSTNEQQRVLEHVRQAKARVMKALDIKTSWLG